jgi:hypothetical protein
VFVEATGGTSSRMTAGSAGATSDTQQTTAEEILEAGLDLVLAQQAKRNGMVLPRARGGGSTVDNLRLLCRFHSDLAARQELGDACMDRFTRSGAAPRAAGTATPPE